MRIKVAVVALFAAVLAAFVAVPASAATAAPRAGHATLPGPSCPVVITVDYIYDTATGNTFTILDSQLDPSMLVENGGTWEIYFRQRYCRYA